MPRWEALAPVAQAYHNYLKANNEGKVEQANQFADMFYKQAQTAVSMLGIQSDAEKLKQQREMAPFEVQRLQMQTESLSEDVKEKKRQRGIHEEIARRYNVPIELVEDEARRLELKQKTEKVKRELELDQPKLAAEVEAGTLVEAKQKQEATQETKLIPEQVKGELQRTKTGIATDIEKQQTAEANVAAGLPGLQSEEQGKILQDQLNLKLLNARIEKLSPGETLSTDEAILAAGGNPKIVALLESYAKTGAYSYIAASLSRMQSLRMAIGLLDKGATPPSLLSYLPGRDATGIQGSTPAGARSYLSTELAKEKAYLKIFGLDYDEIYSTQVDRTATRIEPRNEPSRALEVGEIPPTQPGAASRTPAAPTTPLGTPTPRTTGQPTTSENAETVLSILLPTVVRDYKGLFGKDIAGYNNAINQVYGGIMAIKRLPIEQRGAKFAASEEKLRQLGISDEEINDLKNYIGIQQVKKKP